ncbi:MAG: hypothetical protein IJD37_05950 [Clostridia bacterium]|nr:hypothetical protein [Clostridia bacterium]
MKTLKALKITSIINTVFCFCCIIFSVCLIINQHYSIGIVKTVGTIGAFGFLLNPSALVTFIVNLVFFLAERHSFEARQLIGKKYIWIFVWPVITTLFYFIAMGFLIEITGGV